MGRGSQEAVCGGERGGEGKIPIDKSRVSHPTLYGPTSTGGWTHGEFLVLAQLKSHD